MAVIEDLHWADDATLDLIKFAGRRLAGRTAMLILTYRDDEIHNDHPLRLVLGDLASGEPLADLLDAVDLEPQRSRLRTLRAEALLACARVRLDTDQPRHAGELAGRVLDDDPYLESGWISGWPKSDDTAA